MDKHCISLFFFLFLGMFHVNGQFDILNIQEDYSDDLVLFDVPWAETTFLINKCGEIINIWNHDFNAGLSAQLTPEGNLLRAEYVPDGCCYQASAGGLIQLLDWEGNPIWEYLTANDSITQHHDFTLLENGNIIYLGWEVANQYERNNLGDTISTNELWTEFVKEIKPSPDSITVVWEWHLKNHLIQDIDLDKSNYAQIQNSLGKVNINYIGPTVNLNGVPIIQEHRWHANAIDYNKERDEVLINSRNSNEFWIIDHSTTTEEAKTNVGGNSNKGGQILFRWGNPLAYNRGNSSQTLMFGSHGLKYIRDGEKKGQIIFFNNGQNRPDGDYSTVEIIDPLNQESHNYELNSDSIYILNNHEIVYGMDQTTEPLYSRQLSNVLEIESGYLINEGIGARFFEINNENEIVWEMEVNIGFSAVFKIHTYKRSFSGFENKNLDPISSNNLASQFQICNPLNSDEDLDPNEIFKIANPAMSSINFYTQHKGLVLLTHATGQLIKSQKLVLGDNTLDIADLMSGIYFITFNTDLKTKTHKIIINH